MNPNFKSMESKVPSANFCRLRRCIMSSVFSGTLIPGRIFNGQNITKCFSLKTTISDNTCFNN